MRVLVTGGAGYIGSVVVEQLLADAHEVVVLDDLRKGHSAALAPEVPLVRIDLCDRERVRALLTGRSSHFSHLHPFDAVVHMAADSLVGESMQRPGAYYRNNLVAGLELLDAMVDAGVTKLVFSSTAAVYGDPDRQPIDEDTPTQPTNTYGQTKLSLEQAFPWYAHAHGLRAVSLRYFNAAGASLRCGEHHEPETHLIPLVLDVALGARPELTELTIHGDDYPTPDGTCLRDYIHVVDLARAHVLALASLDGERGERANVYNLGCGGGYSVREVIDAAQRITGVEIPVRVGPRRAGDPAVLVASSSRIQRELGWTPKLESLDAIVGSAWQWRQRHPWGYPAEDLTNVHEHTPVRVSRSQSRA
jgi:UDP-glucose 4-epimerase